MIEVLLALSILSVGIVSVLGSLQNLMGLVQDTEAFAEAQLLCERLMSGWRLEAPETGSLRGRSRDGRFDWELRTDAWSPEWPELEADPIADERFKKGLRMARLTVQWKDGLRRRSLIREELLPVDSFD